MPKISSRNRPPVRGALLIASLSGRALARAAVEAGYAPLVADFFADLDTDRLAAACIKLPGPLGDGFQWPSLEPALASLAAEALCPVLGVVYGAGFEDRPHLLDKIAAHWPLLGNDAGTVEAIKAPEHFFPLLRRLAIAHPETVTTRPRTLAGWLAKRRGGAGGSHVRLGRLIAERDGVYYQSMVKGRSVSALFVADGTYAQIVGFSEQWTAPAPGRLYRYGGAVRPASVPNDAAQIMGEAVSRLTRTARLKGLGSADFMLAENQTYLLEVNPRPGATLDLFAGARDPMLDLHITGVQEGKLPGNGMTFEGAAAAGVVFTPERLIVPRSMKWPLWAADLPRPGERIDKQCPICTVQARAKTAAHARRLVEARTASLVDKIMKLEGESLEQEEHR